MQNAAWRIELELAPDRPDPVGNAAQIALADRGLPLTKPLRSGRAYLLPACLDQPQVETVAQSLLADSVTESISILALLLQVKLPQVTINNFLYTVFGK